MFQILSSVMTSIISQETQHALDKLVDTVKIIHLCDNIKFVEEKHVENIFTLLTSELNSDDSLKVTQKNVYFNFLQHVHKNMSFSMIILCAVSLELSAVISMKN